MIDGTSVVPFLAYREYLTISRADGSGNTDIRFPVLDNALMLRPVWAADGAIYFRRGLKVEGNQRGWFLWKIEAGETEPQRIEETGPISSFWVSPKGWFAYTTTCEVGTQEEGEEKQWKTSLFVTNEKGERILERPDAYKAAWSPDGRQLAYFTAKGEEEEERRERDCTIFDTLTRKEQTVPLGRHYRLSGMKWSPDKKRILFTSSDKRVTYGMMHVLTVAEEDVTDIPNAKPGSYDALWEWIGPDEIVYEEDNCLWVIKVGGSKKRKIFSPGK